MQIYFKPGLSGRGVFIAYLMDTSGPERDAEAF